MVFKKMLAKLGIGGPSVDTVLAQADTQPGRLLRGEVKILGGEQDAEIDYVTLSLVTRAETEAGDSEYTGTAEFARLQIAGAFPLAAGTHHNIPFEMLVPWETPITHVDGRGLPGMVVGVRTELAVAKAIDKSDLDDVRVHPLGSQEAALQAFTGLGFRIKHADVENGGLAGVPQRLPFYQEIEFHPPASVGGRVNEVELTFIATEQDLHVVLEADRRGGVFRSGGDNFGRWQLPHDQAEKFDWADQIGTWLSQTAGRANHGGHGGGHGGMGGMAAGVAGGIVGGLVAGEIIDEVGDAFFGDED